MPINLGGKPFQIVKRNVGTRIREFLDSYSPKEILTTQELAEALSVSYRTVRSDYGTDPSLTPYRQKIPFEATRKLVWGNPKAIQELRRQLHEA